MDTAWWLLFGIYLMGFFVTIYLFASDASPSYDEPEEDVVALTLVMGLFWPITAMVIYGEWRKDRRKAV